MRFCPSCHAVFKRAPSYCPFDGTALQQPAEDPLLEQQLGRYRLLRLIGSGASGRVYLARHLELGTEVALKLLYSDGLAASNAQQRFLREAQALSRLRHPHVISLLDFSASGGAPFLVMELATGRTLADLIKEQGSLGLARIRELGSQLASALAEAHRSGLVHRDLKPQNIIISKIATGEHAQILDFGLVGVLEGEGEQELTQSGIVFGTPGYMAPEQSQSAKVGASADMYALGTILYEAFAGQRPFATSAEEELTLKVAAPAPRLSGPPPFSELVAELLDRNPQRRPNATQVFERLQKSWNLQPPQPEEDTYSQEHTAPAPWTRFFERFGIATALVLFVCLTTAGLAWWQWPRGEQLSGVQAQTEASVSKEKSVDPKQTATRGPVGIPIRFLNLQACVGCQPDLAYAQSQELVEFAYRVFRSAQVVPYVASVEHVFFPQLNNPNARLSRSQLFSGLQASFTEMDAWPAPEQQTAQQWLAWTSNCVAPTNEVLVWVWDGPSIATPAAQGRAIFINREALNSEPSLLTRLLGQHFGLSAAFRDDLGRGWDQPGKVAFKDERLSPEDSRRLKLWARGDSPRFDTKGTCAGVDRRFRAEPAHEQLWWSNRDFSFARANYFRRPTGLKPVSADFDGNGVDDLLWYLPGPRKDVLHLFAKDRSYRSVVLDIEGNYQLVAADFDGSGQADLLLARPRQAETSIWWELGGKQPSLKDGLKAPAWQDLAGGDFNGDGRSDLLWLLDNGQVEVSWSQSERRFLRTAIQRRASGKPNVGDFDADGCADIFWYNPGGEQRDELWFGQPSGSFRVVHRRLQVYGHYRMAVGDFDGDGRSDLLWRSSGRRASIWRSLGDGRFTPKTMPSLIWLWPIAADLNGDGADDIVWYDR